VDTDECNTAIGHINFQSAIERTEDTVTTSEYRDKTADREPAVATVLLCKIQNALSKLVENM
jgi:hypothetical protein